MSEWCNKCKRMTEQKRKPEDKGQNYDTICNVCGHANSHIQGFNANLM